MSHLLAVSKSEVRMQEIIEALRSLEPKLKVKRTGPVTAIVIQPKIWVSKVRFLETPPN